MILREFEIFFMAGNVGKWKCLFYKDFDFLTFFRMMMGFEDVDELNSLLSFAQFKVVQTWAELNPIAIFISVKL